MNSTKKLLEKFRIQKGYNLISLPAINLTEEEADRFIDYMVDESAIKGFARIVRMNLPQQNIRQIGFGSGKFLYPADQFDETKYKKQFAANKITLTTAKARGCAVVYDDDLEDIRGVETEDQFKDQLMRIIAGKIQNELEVAYWAGEKHALNGFAADDLNGLWDGWRYRLTHSAYGAAYYNAVTGSAHLLDATGGGTTGSPFILPGKIAEQAATEPFNWEFKYAAMLRAMPAKYKTKGLANFRFIHSDIVTQDYIEALSARNTSLGDAVLTGTSNPPFGKVQILDAPLMPITMGSPAAEGTDADIDGGAYADALFIPKDNLIVGIQRDIKIESKREPADEATYIFYTLRTDVAVENVDACVLTRGLTHGN